MPALTAVERNAASERVAEDVRRYPRDMPTTQTEATDADVLAYLQAA